ncbi:MAG: hypothetical protein JXA71_17195 [Chitinispirillaceae bacterium]|nr:hypothetical protein [Chitinispirillaceae bacterium]
MRSLCGAVMLLVFAVAGSADGGTVQVNRLKAIHMDGKHWDLGAELSKNRHLLVHCVMRRCLYCSESVPALNAVWKKYGCDRCDSFPVLVLEVNVGVNDPKQWFREEYLEPNMVCYPAVWYGDGGDSIDQALSNYGYGNYKYWIKPDGSFVKEPVIDDQLAQACISPHVCAAGIIGRAKAFSTGMPGISFERNTGMVRVLVCRPGAYTISRHSLAGKVIESRSLVLPAGSTRISLKPYTGISLITIKNPLLGSSRCRVVEFD